MFKYPSRSTALALFLMLLSGPFGRAFPQVLDRHLACRQGQRLPQSQPQMELREPTPSQSTRTL